MPKSDDSEVLKFASAKWYVELGVFFVSATYTPGPLFSLVPPHVCLNYLHLSM